MGKHQEQTFGWLFPSVTCVVSRFLPLKENHIPSTIKQKEVNNTEYLRFYCHCFSMWCSNPDDHFLSQSGIHSFPSTQMYSSCRSLRLIFSKPIEYLYHQGQCYISNCTFLLIRNLAEGCAKPYAFICRWHFYFHWMMRCPLFLIPFPLKWQM